QDSNLSSPEKILTLRFAGGNDVIIWSSVENKSVQSGFKLEFS
ncbi:hypothetical protein A2U01_0055730, partial [Trifolium medium]|nr:hypothetical protein [Trifolium medium]